MLDAVRCFEERESGCRGIPPDGEIGRIETGIDQAIDAALGGMTLRDLARALDASASPTPFVDSGQG
jgi:membrane protein